MNDFQTFPGLDSDQLATFAGQLDEQQRFRTEQLIRHQVRSSALGRPETAADVEVRDILLHGARDALLEIRAAQRRMADGTFGRCIDCHTSLPIERLEVLPSVARCLACHRSAIGSTSP